MRVTAGGGWGFEGCWNGMGFELNSTTSTGVCIDVTGGGYYVMEDGGGYKEG